SARRLPHRAPGPGRQRALGAHAPPRRDAHAAPRIARGRRRGRGADRRLDPDALSGGSRRARGARPGNATDAGSGAPTPPGRTFAPRRSGLPARPEAAATSAGDRWPATRILRSPPRAGTSARARPEGLPPASLPLDRPRRLARDVEHDPVDAAHLVGDPAADLAQDVDRQALPV